MVERLAVNQMVAGSIPALPAITLELNGTHESTVESGNWVPWSIKIGDIIRAEAEGLAASSFVAPKPGVYRIYIIDGRFIYSRPNMNSAESWFGNGEKYAVMPHDEAEKAVDQAWERNR